MQKIVAVKEKYQTVISKAKLKQYKSNTKLLNESTDSTQLWHRYDKVLGKKINNIVEPIYNNESGLHIFDDQKISEKLQKFHVENIGKNEFDLQFKHEIEEEIDFILELNQPSSSEIFFNITYIKQVIKNSNNSSAPGPDRITVELVQNMPSHAGKLFSRVPPKTLEKRKSVTGLVPSLEFLKDLFLSPFIFLVFTADMALEEPEQTPETHTESKYADDFNFWRIRIRLLPPVNTNANCYNQPPDWCLK